MGARRVGSAGAYTLAEALVISPPQCRTCSTPWWPSLLSTCGAAIWMAGGMRGWCSSHAPVELKSSTQLVRLPQPLPRVAPTRDSPVVRSLLAAPPCPS